MKLTKLSKICAFLFLLFLVPWQNAISQMRQVYVDDMPSNNQIFGLSFYSASSGFVAFRDWIGYTTDSGRSFQKKYITYGNVDFNGYLNVNLTFGFGVNGVKAFNKDTLIVYGNFGYVSSILYSNNGGTTFKLVYHSIYDINTIGGHDGITAMSFPNGTQIGYCVDQDRIIKTTNGGLNWNVIYLDPESYFNHINGIDENNLYVLSSEERKLLKTSNGSTWTPVTMPSVGSFFANFLTANIGWAGIGSGNSVVFYKTTNGGATWAPVPKLYPGGFSVAPFTFINEDTAFALGEDNFMVSKTTDGGSSWEPLPRDNDFSYLGYQHNDLQVFSGSQLWAGGGYGFLELNTNAGGISIPKALFVIDTFLVPGTVSLRNYSKTGYQYQWFLNGQLISTNYNASYIHDISRPFDTIKLVTNNGTYTDTAINRQFFIVPVPPLPSISSFAPSTGYTGSTVTITGLNFTGTSQVSFGDSAVQSFTVKSNTEITAIVGNGATGNIKVTTPYGNATKPGFISYTPLISSFTPTSGGFNTAIQVRGKGFSSVYTVRCGGYDVKSFQKIGDTLINAVLGYGVSGAISTVASYYGSGSLPGFTYLPAPSISNFSPVAAMQSDTITIQGSGFNQVDSIKIGGKNATSIIAVSPTIIKAVVGEPQSGFVTVFTSRGAATLNGFTNLSPIINSVVPSTGTAGAKIEISGQNFNHITSVEICGVPVDSFTVNSPSNITAIIGIGTPDTTGTIAIWANGQKAINKSAFLITNAPIIRKILPASGIPGSEVRIVGENFNPAANSNTVYFGAVKATVTNASKNELIVKVPTGATYSPILVYNNKLIGISNQYFLPSSPLVKNLTKNGLAPRVDYPLKSTSNAISTADFDNDGQPDIVARSHDTITVFRNISEKGKIQFVKQVERFVLYGSLLTNEYVAHSIPVADIDGDGKIDIIVMTPSGLSILINTSTSGIISFASPVSILISLSGTAPNATIGDIDCDGKIDIVLACFPNYALYYFKNISTPGSIKFIQSANIKGTVNFNPIDVALVDLTDDGKPEIVVSNSISAIIGGGAYFENNSYGNNISFGKPQLFGLSGFYTSVAAVDLSKDDKPDILLCTNALSNAPSTPAPHGYAGNSITWYPALYSLFKDTHKIIGPGEDLYIEANSPQHVVVGSLNGDDKPDILVSGLAYDSRSFDEYGVMMQNSSSAESGSFSTTAFGSTNSKTFIIADLDMDGKSDIVTAHPINRFISIYRNRAGEPIQLCSGGSSILVSEMLGNAHQWQRNLDGIHFYDITDNANYSGSNKDTLKLLSIPDSLAHARYRCIVDGIAGEAYKTAIVNKWTGAADTNWENPNNWSCGMIPAKNTNVIIESGAVLLNSNDSISSITLGNQAHLIIATGKTLVITGKSFGTDSTNQYIVETISPSNITTNTAVAGGNVLPEFSNAGILSRGIVWSDAPAPDIALSTKTINGSGTGTFSSTINGLESNKTYYLRAYAITPTDTAYGDEYSFTTEGLPKIITGKISELTDSSAFIEAVITDNGGSVVTTYGIVWSESPGPIVSLPGKTVASGVIGYFKHQLTGLSPRTLYYVRPYATNTIGTSYGPELILTTADFSGYPFVTIGNQVWMSKNLDVTRYRNGDSIPHITDPWAWNSAVGAWRWYNDDSATYSSYGRLYNWYALTDPRGIAPDGWHIPSKNEFEVLKTSISGHGGYLKEVGTAHWQSPNTGATNITGFTALPAGATSSSFGIGSETLWWTSSILQNGPVWYWWLYRLIYSSDSFLEAVSEVKNVGLSIRCVHD